MVPLGRLAKYFTPNSEVADGSAPKWTEHRAPKDPEAQSGIGKTRHRSCKPG